jgi:hypothetical protein
MSHLRKFAIAPLLVVSLLLVGAAPALADNVCPVIGGPNDPSIKGTPAIVPDMDANPAHGADPSDPHPGDAFWN